MPHRQHRINTQRHKFPLTDPRLHTTGDHLLLRLPPLTSTQRGEDGIVRRSDTGNSIFILTRRPPSLPCLNTQLDPRLFLCIFHFCSLPWLPRKDSLCCLSSHLLLPTVGICLFKLSPILSGLSLSLFNCLFPDSVFIFFCSLCHRFLYLPTNM